MKLAEVRIREVIERFNQEEKCGFCWVFWNPMNEDFKRPLYDKYGECCNVVEVQMLNYQQLGNVIEGDRMVIREISVREIFDLELRVMTNAGNAVYVPLSDSDYYKIIEPLYNCYLDLLMDCNVRGSFMLENWNARPVLKKDENFSGIYVQGITYKKYLR